MRKIISMHSFRGGTGKSNISANIAALMAQQGLRVGVIDTDIQSPGIHTLFGMDANKIGYSLNDYLWGKCKIEDACHDVTAALGAPVKGKVYLTPSSIRAGEIARILRKGYDVSLLNNGFQGLLDTMKLDVLIIDTHPGINEEILLSIAISDILVVLLRPDQQDYQGTSVTVELARKLDIPKMLLLVNKVPGAFPEAEVRSKVEKAYRAEVLAVLPHSSELMTLASSGIFAMRFPDHPVTAQLRQVAQQLIAA